MPLVPGTRVGPYEVVSLLGAGAMGEVYRAGDARLKREVALKILPQGFADDVQRMSRFEREAQLLAALNHPGIASIYGLEESGAVRALVIELVEGPTLTERIARKPLPLREALVVARQIAEALEYAHERGIIHRDLKPDNIKLAPGDAVKVLDFGLAKALAGDPVLPNIADSPTISEAVTQAGFLLGTPAYMSPEQARGKPLDRRTDIWSFGCVLFEMLTGRKAFGRATVTDSLAAVLTKEPDLERLPESTPSRIRQLIERCLRKETKERLQSIGDARIEIEDALASRPTQDLPTSQAAHARSGSASRKVIAATLLIVVVAAAVVVWWVRAREPHAPNWSGDMISGPNIALGPRISLDGRTLAFQAMIDNLTQVAVTNPDTGNWSLLTHDRQHGFVNEISWAPDGSKLYFDRNIGIPAGVYSVAVLGGEERLVLANAGCPEALPDGSLLVIHQDNTGHWRIHHYWPDSQRLDALPGWVGIDTTIPLRLFPDGAEAVFNGKVTPSDAADHYYVMDVATGRTRRLAPSLPSQRTSESSPIAPTADGRAVLLDVPAGNLHRIVSVPRDGKDVVQTVMTLTKPPWYMDVARDGTLYLDQVDRPHEILRLPLSGGIPEVLASSDAYDPGGLYMEPVETTNGRFLLDSGFAGMARLLMGAPHGDFVPLLDTTEQTSSPAVSIGNDEVALLLGSGDSQMLAIASTADGRIIRRLTGTKGHHIKSLAISPDGRTLYFVADHFIWTIPVEDGAPRKLAAGDGVTVNPDGRTLILTLSQESDPTFVSVSSDGGDAKGIRVGNSQSVAPVPVGSHALNRQGRMLINISPAGSWFYRVAVLDLATGSVTPIPVTYAGDTMSANWAADGQVLAVGLPLKSHVWRFRLATP